MPNLTVTIHLTAEDMVEASRTTPPTTIRRTNAKRQIRGKLICISIISIIIAAAVIRLHPTELSLWTRLALASVSVAIYWVVCRFIWLGNEKWKRFAISSVTRSMVFLVKLVYAGNKGVFCDHTFIISEEGLTEITEVNHTLNSWTDFKDADISSDFIVARTSRHVHTLPRRDFASEIDHIQFAQELRLRIPKGYNYDGFPALGT